MSADRPDAEFVDDRETDRIPDDAPLREIVPDDFVARSGESTLREAIKAAERQTSRDPDALPRCPECLDVRIRSKKGRPSREDLKDGDYKCTSCSHHFDDPAPSRDEARKGDQTTFREVMRR